MSFAPVKLTVKNDYPVKLSTKDIDVKSNDEQLIKNTSIKSHNQYRALHKNTSMLVWDENLANESQKWAEKIAKLGGLKHGSTGENIFMTGSSVDVDIKTACKEAVDSWYSEIENYNLRSHSHQGTVGHFTQVVWSSSTKLGVGVSKIKSNGMTEIYVVARYKPAGNVVGRNKSNVNPLK